MEAGRRARAGHGGIAERRREGSFFEAEFDELTCGGRGQL